MEGLPFVHVFKTILIVSYGKDKVLTWLIFHPTTFDNSFIKYTIDTDLVIFFQLNELNQV